MQGRLYDSRIGRFMQADAPFMESPGWSQGLNRYSYVFNNPLNATDPNGFEVGGPSTYERAEDGEDGDYSYFYGDDPLSLNGHSGGDSQSSGGDEAETSPAEDSEDNNTTCGPETFEEDVDPGEDDFDFDFDFADASRLAPTDVPANRSSTPVRAPEPGEPVFLGKPLGEHVKDTITFFVVDPLECILGDACGDGEAMIAAATFGKAKGFGKARKIAQAESQAAKGVKIGGKPWAALAPGATACRSGCESVAQAIQKAIGGEVKVITSPGRYLGRMRNAAGELVNPAGDKALGWANHHVVVKGGMVYDAITGPNGMAASTYKQLWEYADALNFGF